MTELLDLCYDVLIRILEEIDAEDLAACAQASWGFNSFIKENKRLYKTHYLKNFDDPRLLHAGSEPDWVSELQKLVRCRKILQSGSTVDAKVGTHGGKSSIALLTWRQRDHFGFVASAIDGLVKTGSLRDGSSRNAEELIEAFKIPQNLDSFAYRSSLYARAGTDSQKVAENEDDRQLSAKLHCLYGAPLTTIGRRGLSIHPYARSRVYDLRNYTEKTKWGPWRKDGSMRVDWEMVESLMVVLSYSSTLCCRRFMPTFRPPWTEPFEGVVSDRILPEYPLTLPMEPDVPLHLKDPFNVSGIWSRIVCFLDYNDLYHFNFGAASRIPADQPRDALTNEEAIRHIILRFQVTHIEAPGEFDSPDLPVVHFKGLSRVIDMSWDPNASSKIRGTVRLTNEGEVRWRTISVFQGGEERWASEGVQVGGRNAARGVIGTWFDKDHDQHGPAGPTAFWKVSDRRDLAISGEDEEQECAEDGWN